MAQHIETNSQVRANNLVETIDEELGLPAVGVNVGPGDKHVDLSAASAWVENPQGNAPPGVAVTWDEPLVHPVQAARFSVVVTPDVMAKIVGKQPPGWAQAIQAQNAVERGPEWFSG